MNNNDFEEWYKNWSKSKNIGYIAIAEASCQACQSLNDKRIQQLLAVIELQRQALQAMFEDGWLLHGPEGMSNPQQMVKEALAITPESFELVEVGEYEADVHVCEFYPNKSAFNLYNYKNGKLYTIKQKD